VDDRLAQVINGRDCAYERRRRGVLGRWERILRRMIGWDLDVRDELPDLGL
jgi:hypothetical protein